MNLYVNLKECNLDYVKECFRNKDLVSVQDILDNFDEALEIIESLKQEIKRLERKNDEEFEEEVKWGEI